MTHSSNAPTTEERIARLESIAHEPVPIIPADVLEARLARTESRVDNLIDVLTPQIKVACKAKIEEPRTQETPSVWHHMPTIGVAGCGADYADMCKTEIATNVTCLDCLHNLVRERVPTSLTQKAPAEWASEERRIGAEIERLNAKVGLVNSLLSANVPAETRAAVLRHYNQCAVRETSRSDNPRTGSHTQEDLHTCTGAGSVSCKACEESFTATGDRFVPPGMALPDDTIADRMGLLDEACRWLADAGHKPAADKLHEDRNRFICAPYEGDSTVHVHVHGESRPNDMPPPIKDGAKLTPEQVAYILEGMSEEALLKFVQIGAVRSALEATRTITNAAAKPTTCGRCKGPYPCICDKPEPLLALYAEAARQSPFAVAALEAHAEDAVKKYQAAQATSPQEESPIGIVQSLRALVLMHDEGYTRAVAKILGGDYEYERAVHGANGMAKIAYAKARSALFAAESRSDNPHPAMRGAP